LSNGLLADFLRREIICNLNEWVELCEVDVNVLCHIEESFCLKSNAKIRLFKLLDFSSIGITLQNLTINFYFIEIELKIYDQKLIQKKFHISVELYIYSKKTRLLPTGI
jgi:hypothetical protein